MTSSISDFDLNVIDNMSSDGFYVVSVFGMTLASIAYMAKQFEIKMNWSSIRYRPDVAKYSWLWSKCQRYDKRWNYKCRGTNNSANCYESSSKIVG